MGCPEYREQFCVTLTMLEEAKVAYVHLVDGLAFGFHKLGEFFHTMFPFYFGQSRISGRPVTLKDARKVYNGALIGNCGYTQETAEIAIASGDADMIAFGRLYIANPDLVDRFTNRQLLAETPATSVWYSGGAAGYTDFPQ